MKHHRHNTKRRLRTRKRTRNRKRKRTAKAAVCVEARASCWVRRRYCSISAQTVGVSVGIHPLLAALRTRVLHVAWSARYTAPHSLFQTLRVPLAVIT